MADQTASSKSSDLFEYMLLEGDPDHLKTVSSTPNTANPWIGPSSLKLRHRIGRGPYGDVWIATYHHCTEDSDRYQEVAVKTLHPLKDNQIQAFLARFDDLFSKCKDLKNVCFLHGASIQDGILCIAMKFYEGSVGDKLAHRKGGRLPLLDVLRYGIDVVCGVMELHSKGVLVLNLKPYNILLNEHDQAILGEFGIPSLLFELGSPNTDIVQRLGTPNYMAPEQWEPGVRAPISFETDAWGFGCTMIEMLSGLQPWRGRTPDEIYNLVVVKQEKPNIPYGLPPEMENVLSGCFEYDLRKRPLMEDIVQSFKSCHDSIQSDSSWTYSSDKTERSWCSTYTNWSVLKDQLQVGDIIRSRKVTNSCKPESMEIPEGTVVGIEIDGSRDDFVLVRVHGYHDPLRVRSSMVERVTFGFSAGDWVRKKEDKRHSPIGILHSIHRDGAVSVGFIGMETLWKGNYTELQMAESFCVGQFLKVKSNVTIPRFEWPLNERGAWAVGRVCQVFANGCLLVKFPGRFRFGEALSYLADPAEVEVVSFKSCEGLLKKYQHLEDFHWAVRPLIIAFGLFAAVKAGSLVPNIGRSKGKCSIGSTHGGDGQQQDAQNVGNNTWLPPSVANIFCRDGVAPAR